VDKDRLKCAGEVERKSMNHSASQEMFQRSGKKKHESFHFSRKAWEKWKEKAIPPISQEMKRGLVLNFMANERACFAS
jgi:hypothetical protein